MRVHLHRPLADVEQSRGLGHRELEDVSARQDLTLPPGQRAHGADQEPDLFVPDRWREGDAVLVASAPGGLDLAAEAALIRFVWKAAPVLTLAHDVSDGGIELALLEAAEHSGVAAQVDVPETAPGGQILLACAPENVERLGSKGVRRIGTVG